MNIFGWKSTGRGLLRPGKMRVQQDRLSGVRTAAMTALGECPKIANGCGHGSELRIF
jgi:hypothetical protein